jgi:hypothetical protein
MRRILLVLAIVVVTVLTTTPPIAAKTAEPPAAAAAPPLLRPSVPMLDVADEAKEIGDRISRAVGWLVGYEDEEA